MRRAKKSGPTDRAPRCARRPRFEEIEPRILYSADVSPALLDDAALLPMAEHRLLDHTGEKRLSPGHWNCASDTVCAQDLGPGNYLVTVDATGYQPVKVTIAPFRITDVAIP